MAVNIMLCKMVITLKSVNETLPSDYVVLFSALNKKVLTWKSEFDDLSIQIRETECYVRIVGLYFISFNFEQQFGISSLLCWWFPWSGSVSQINLPPTSAWCSSFWWSKSMHSSARCMMSFSLVSGETWSPEDSIEQDLRGLTCLVIQISP